MKKIVQVSFLLFLAFCSINLYATHIRALEITAERISTANLTFKFTITGYRDIDGVQFASGDFNFGDGTSYDQEKDGPIPWVFVESVGNDTEKWQFTLTHTYSGPGAYKVSYIEPFRNDGISNIANSVGTFYYTETLILIDPLIGINSTPILTVPPIDLGGSGLIFIHNPGAFDVDGDSLSYSMSIPLQGRDFEVGGYKSLIDPSFYPEGFNQGNEAMDGPPTLVLNSSGDLIWDAAAKEGEYNVSFIVEEWRKINGVYFRLGFVTRDMQIIVEDTDNNPPELEVPDELCVAAGTLIDDSVYDPDIVGTDPDGHPVTIEAFGGPFEVSLPATFSPDPPTIQGPPGFLSFEWATDCSHIRNRPYEVRFKIQDNPPFENGKPTAPKLVDFETWEITIVGPAPENLITTPLPGKRMQLDWDSYSCPNTGASMQVWRRVGEFPFAAEDCEIGIPENAGYELIATLPIDSDVYIDNNNGLGLAPGANYCYRLVAEFPQPTGGTSYASEEACSEIEAIVPLITKVDVVSTSEITGEVRVEWIDPLDIDMGMFPGPYTYEILRSTSQESGSFVSVQTGLTNQFFDDSGLNTDDETYSYKILLYDNTGEAVDTSFAASTVRLELVPQVGAMKVTWNADVPWSNSNPNYKIHEVYRDNINPLNLAELQLIASVDVTQSGFIFVDDGSFDGEPLDEEVTYCYVVITQGSYDNDDPLVPDPLVNQSQIQCARPNDEIAPCTPISFEFDESVSCEALLAVSGSCDFDAFQNKLLWELDMASECDDDVVSFNIYFSETGVEGSYLLLTNTMATTYTHLGISSFKGCYKIAAVDRSGNESELSTEICNENCIFDDNGKLGYILPNAFSPNGDGFNDTFRAFGDNDPNSCPRFVLSVDFQVIDRTGKTLFTFSSLENENDIYIDWDGKTNSGKELAAGTYYYSANVTFDTLDPSLAKQKLNGWIQILK